MTALLVSTQVQSDATTFRGKVKSELPKLNSYTSEVPVSDVKEFIMQVYADAGICRLQDDPIHANNHAGGKVCLVQWRDDFGAKQSGLGVKGVVSGSGTKQFSYTLTIFDNGEFLPFTTGVETYNFLEPVLPSNPSIESQWSIKPTSTEVTHDIYNKSEVMQTLIFTATERNYPQQMNFGEHSCVIHVSEKECMIQVEHGFAEIEHGTGTENFEYSLTDSYDFFKPDLQNFAVSWDFRPAEILAYHVNTQDSRLPMVISDYEETLVLYPDQFAVVIASPHGYKEGDWWYPTNPEITLKIDDDFDYTDTLLYEDNPVKFRLNLGEIGDHYLLSPLSSPKKLGDKLVYIYDFSSVSDGLYDVDISTKDSNDNGDVVKINDIYIDRLPADLQFIVNGKQFNGRSTILYAMSDVTAIAWGGWDDGTKITKATLNQEPVEFAGGTINIKHFPHELLDLNSLNVLTVTALDNVGNEVTKDLKFRFAPYSFYHQAEDVVKLVEQARVDVTQRSGLRCIYASSPDLATFYSDSRWFRGCTIRWEKMPEGLLAVLPERFSSSANMIANGHFAAEGDYEYKFIIDTWDKYGDSLEVYSGEGILNVAELLKPTLTVGYPSDIANYGENYIHNKPINRALNIPYAIDKRLRSNVTVQLLDDEGGVVSEREFTRNTTNINGYMRFQSEDIQALTLSQYSVKAFYTGHSDIFDVKPYRFYNSPATNVRLFTDHEVTLVEDTSFSVNARITQIIDGEYQYNSDMGVWEVYLAQLVGNEYVEVSSKQITDSNGHTQITVDANTIRDGQNIHIIADLKTPYPDVSHRLISQTLSKIKVLRLNTILGQVETDEARLPVPANFIVRTELDTKSDYDSTLNLIWEQSDDGEHWEDVDTKFGYLARFLFEEPTVKHIRAKLQHKLTQEYTFTNSVKLTAFNQPQIEITADQRVVHGARAMVTVTTTDYTKDNAVGPLEWSLDGEQTWQPMSQSESIVVINDMDIVARQLIRSEDKTEPNFYVTDTAAINVTPPIALRANIVQSLRAAEANEVVNFNIRLRDFNEYGEDRIRTSFTLPNGDHLEGLDLTHILENTDFIEGRAKFIFRAWIDGYKLQTLSTNFLYVREIIYEFPESTLGISHNEIVIKSPFTALVAPKTLRYVPKTVLLESIWSAPEGVNILKEYANGMGRVLEIEEPGVHQLNVEYKDNRGNSKIHTVFLEGLEAPDMIIDFVTTPSNEFMRVPLEYIIRAKVKPGLPRDYVSNYDWSLNGDSLGVTQYYTEKFEFEEPGNYEISVTATTKKGQIHTEKKAITVIQNQPPQCEPYWEIRSSSIVMHSNCNDVDGVITHVDYTYLDPAGNEQTIRSVSQAIRFAKASYERIVVTFTVNDDSGDTFEKQVTWPE